MQLVLQTPRREWTYAHVVRAVCLSTILLSGRGAHADGAAAPRLYNAFDLAAPRAIAWLDVGNSAVLKGGLSLQNNNVIACAVGLNAPDKQLQIAPNKTTYPLYTQRVPAKLAVVPAITGPAPSCTTPAEQAQPQCTKLVAIEFDNGEAASGTYESSSLRSRRTRSTTACHH